MGVNLFFLSMYNNILDNWGFLFKLIRFGSLLFILKEMFVFCERKYIEVLIS